MQDHSQVLSYFEVRERLEGRVEFPVLYPLPGFGIARKRGEQIFDYQEAVDVVKGLLLVFPHREFVVVMVTETRSTIEENPYLEKEENK
jgi:hypothetical protein